MSAAHQERRAMRRSLLVRLRLLQLRLWLELFLKSAARGLCFGLAIALGGALALVAQAGVVQHNNLALAALGGLGLGVLWGVIRPPSLSRTARTADDRFGLEARTGTAVELLRRSSGRLAESQLVDAARALRGARRGWPFPPAVVWREALVAVVMVGALLGLLRLEGQGPSLLVNLPLSPTEGSVAEDGEREALAAPTPAAMAAADSGGQQATKPSAALRTLDELRRAREAGTLTPEQAEAMLRQVEDELSQQSGEARNQRQTLDRLARALSQVSAGEAAAEQIQEGDLGQAGDELRQLGREADQLSSDAKNQLAQALRRAAAESPRNSTLAERERRAAEALTGRDYQAQQAALAALGDELARQAGQSPSEGDIAAAAERLQAERDAAQGAQSGQSGQRAAAAAQGQQPNSQGGQAGGSQAGQGEGSGRGSGGGEGDGQSTGQGANAPAPDGPAERAAPLELGEAAPSLDVAGKQVEVPARSNPTGQPTGRSERSDGDDGQVMDRADTAFDVNVPAAPVRAGGQSERIVVPGDQRQVVRDYFARRTGKANP